MALGKNKFWEPKLGATFKSSGRNGGQTRGVAVEKERTGMIWEISTKSTGIAGGSDCGGVCVEGKGELKD